MVPAGNSKRRTNLPAPILDHDYVAITENGYDNDGSGMNDDRSFLRSLTTSWHVTLPQLKAFLRVDGTTGWWIWHEPFQRATQLKRSSK